MIHPDTVYSFVPVTKLVPSIRQSELSLNPSGRTGVLLQFTKPLTPGTIDTTSTPRMIEYEFLGYSIEEGTI